MQIGLYEAVSGMKAQAAYQDTLTENMARMSVPGHKRIITAFELPPESALQRASEAALGGTTQNMGVKAAPLQARTVVDFSPGVTHATGNPTDFAIDGDALFKVREKDGTFAYTRNGQFHLDRNGALTTSDGAEVLLQNDIPVNLAAGDQNRLVVEKDGSVRTGPKGTQRGSLALVRADDPRTVFVQGSNGRFVLADPDKDPAKLQSGVGSNGMLRQGYLEDSNTDSISQMVGLVQVVRAYEANQKAVMSQDSVTGQMIQAADPSTS